MWTERASHRQWDYKAAEQPRGWSGEFWGMPTRYWVIALLVIAILMMLGTVLRRGRSMPVLIEKIESNPASSMSVLSIVARPSGILPWILHGMGLGRTYELHASERLVTIKAPSPWRESHLVIPVSRLAAVSARFVFPLFTLVLGFIVAGLVELLSRGGWFFVIALYFVVYSLLNREFRIEVSFGEGFYGFGYKLRRGWTREHLFQAVEQLRMLMVRAQESSAMSSLSTAFPAFPPGQSMAPLAVARSEAAVSTPTPAPMGSSGSVSGAGAGPAAGSVPVQVRPLLPWEPRPPAT